MTVDVECPPGSLSVRLFRLLEERAVNATGAKPVRWLVPPNARLLVGDAKLPFRPGVRVLGLQVGLHRREPWCVYAELADGSSLFGVF